MKSNTQQLLISINAPTAIQTRCHGRKNTKIKLEIDTDPPADFNTEEVPIFKPIPFWTKSYTLPSLFAGKISAMLCRQWQTRVKGRDWYDFLWFLQRNVTVDLKHLTSRLQAYGYYRDKSTLSLKNVQDMLLQKLDEIDLELAKDDIAKFVKDQRSTAAWSKLLFISAIENIR